MSTNYNGRKAVGYENTLTGKSRRAEKVPGERRAEKVPGARRAEKVPGARRAEKVPGERRAEKVQRGRCGDSSRGQYRPGPSALPSRSKKYRIRKGVIKLTAACAVFAAALIASLSLSGRAVRTVASQVKTGSKYYTSITVEPGDTLWSIADTYMDENVYSDKREYISEIKKINKITSDNITSGASLIVVYYR